ncbi:MAG: heme NO-binding domain-containing protein [Bacteroidota bacterium]|nr:heme NO-binding domain-containing protein [Bacteroidota bacterium]
MQNETNVHGSIFFLLRKFIDHSLPPGAWEKLNQAAGSNADEFELTKSYSLDTIGSIIAAASKMTGLSEDTLKERFGEYLVPDLFTLYKNYLRPEWTTYDVLLNTERVMHGAVRKLNSTANPPILNVTAVNEKLLMIDYYSKRRMAGLAIGIIKGIAKYYHEEEKISVKSVTSLNDERVQIRVEFL